MPVGSGQGAGIPCCFPYFSFDILFQESIVLFVYLLMVKVKALILHLAMCNLSLVILPHHEYWSKISSFLICLKQVSWESNVRYFVDTARVLFRKNATIWYSRKKVYLQDFIYDSKDILPVDWYSSFFLWNLLFWQERLTLSVPEKLKNSFFKIPIFS